MDILRTPITVISQNITRVTVNRVPIVRDYCECDGLQVMLINGYSWMANGDTLKADELSNLYDSTKVCPTMYFAEPINRSYAKIYEAVDRGIGVVVSTDVPIGEKMIKALSKNPANSIWIRMNPMENSLQSFYGPRGEGEKTLLKMLYTAKIYRISLGLEINVPPSIDHFLDTLELIEICKNFITDIFVWEVPGSEAPGKLTSTDIINRISSFVSHKKVGLSILGEKTDQLRMRFSSDSKVFKYKNMYYKGDNGKFNNTHPVLEEACPICGKTKFV